MKSWLCIFASLLLPLGLNAAEDTPYTGKLFVGISYRYDFSFEKYWWIEWLPTRISKEILLTGSYWQVESNQGVILVTAAHVLGINWEAKEVDLGLEWEGQGVKHVVGKQRPYETILQRSFSRVLIGTLAYAPLDIGTLKGTSDMAFLRPKNPQVLKDVQMLRLSDTPPRRDERVEICGYPGTGYEQREAAIVTTVREADGFFVLNRPVEPGYSGGVVTNSEGKAYGVITSTDKAEKQTTVLRLTPAMLGRIEWKPAAEALDRDLRKKVEVK